MDTDQILILTTADRMVLQHLYAYPDVPLSLFQLHKAYGFSPAQLGRFLAKLAGIGVVDHVDGNISITEFGKKWFLANRIAIFYSHVTYDWREIPIEMRKRKIEIDSLYAPEERELGKNFIEDVFL